MRKLLVALLILSIISLWFVNNQTEKEPAQAPENDNISAFADQKLANTVWNEFSDPKLLIKHCLSQFKENNDATDCILSTSSADQAKLFSSVLWKIWSGHTVLAKDEIELLQQEESWSLWGNIGLLELALHTGNQTQLGSLLVQFRDSFLSANNTSLLQSYKYYELWYTRNELKWKKLGALLEKYTIEQITRDPELLFLQSNIFFVRGQRDYLEKLLNQTELSARNTVDYTYSLIYLAILKSDTEESKTIINKFAEDSSENIDIVLEKAQMDLLDTSPTVREAALRKIHHIAKLFSKDLGLLLSVMESLLTHHKFDEAGRIFNYIDLTNVILDDFVMFHTIRAWNDIYMAEYEDALLKIEKALKMAPKDLAANWLKVLLAKKLERPDLAQDSLEILLKANPFNKNHINQILHFRNKYKTPELEALYQCMIQRSVNY
jgi:tetratricopeptide (TPR) repeat protein